MILKRELEYYQFEKGRGLQPLLKGEASHPVSTFKPKKITFWLSKKPLSQLKGWHLKYILHRVACPKMTNDASASSERIIENLSGFQNLTDLNHHF